MNPTEWTVIGGGIGGIITALVGYGIIWGRTKASIDTTSSSLVNLKTSVDAHHVDKSIHRDSERDEKFLQQIIDSQDEGFTRMSKWLERIDARCDERGKSCSNHFLKIERKVAAYTGKTNGEED